MRLSEALKVSLSREKERKKKTERQLYLLFLSPFGNRIKVLSLTSTDEYHLNNFPDSCFLILKLMFEWGCPVPTYR